MEIKKGKNKFYMGETEENPVARITWKNGGSNIIVIDHTIVDPSLRGQGIAAKLIVKVAEMARAENLKVVPVCSYAVAKMTRTDEYADILHKV